MRFDRDASYRRPAGALVLLAGSPLRLFRLSSAGARVLDALERGEPLPAGHHRLTDRLLDAGAIHPVPGGGGPFTRDDVTVVIPAFGAQPTTADSSLDVVVVDDGSEPPLSPVAGRRLVRLPRNAGPGGARNAGLAEVTTALVAFVDTEVEPDDGWLEALLPHFADDHVALVAPRVRSAAGGSPLVDRYEAVRGSLDLGAQPARIAAGSRVSYVPAATIVCRVEAVQAVGGFDPALRFGEDVDLVWRLQEAGWRCRYEPAATVRHRNRSTLRGWLTQRFRYGSSAAPLARLHPNALAPLRISAWTAGVWLLVALRRPFAAAALGAGTVVALQRKLHDVPAAESTRLVALGHVLAGRQIADATRRVWWPIAAPLAIICRRARLPLLAAFVVAPVAESIGARRDIGVVQAAAMRVADDVAYGAGVWWGVLRHRTAAPLRPDLTSWPATKRSTPRRRPPS